MRDEKEIQIRLRQIQFIRKLFPKQWRELMQSIDKDVSDSVITALIKTKQKIDFRKINNALSTKLK